MKPAIALLLWLAAGSARAAEPWRIEVDASRPLHPIPRTIYGTFLEPIGKSTYGGLWAQILENPSFEDGLWSFEVMRREVEREPALARASQMGLPFPWEPLDYAQGNRYEPRWGDAANSSRSLLIMALPEKLTGIRQQVYLPVHRQSRYTGSFYARHFSGSGRIEVSLRGRNRAETVFAAAAVEVAGNSWKRYEFRLELGGAAPARLEPADFVLAAGGGSRLLVDQVFLFPSDNVDGMDPEMVEMSRALETPLVRFGGNFTSGYHWKDGVGAIDKRVSMLNQAWGIPEYNHFGTDEFLTFCRRIGAEPQVCLNLGSGTPEEAAGWVSYVNLQTGRQGLLWELGNELFGGWQIGWLPEESIAARTAAFSRAVREADPSARIIATGRDPDNYRDWNARLLALGPGVFDFLATHFVVGTANVRRRDSTPEFAAYSALALPLGLERKLREMKAQIDNDPRIRGRVKLAFTEWLFHGPDDRVPRFTNMGGALLAAGFLNALMRVSEFTPVADMTGLIEFGGIWKKRGRVYGVPAYWAFRMYSTARGAERLAPVSVTGESYDVADGNGRIPDIPGVPYLDVVAARDGIGSRLTLFCVNRHLTRDLPASIVVKGFRPAGAAQVRTLRGTSIFQANDEMRPEAVRPAETSEQIPRSGWTHTFPRASVTVIEIN